MQFVLVHGSWQDGRCWDATVSELRAAGHDAFAPTLPGNGDQANPAVTMAETAAAVVEVLTSNDLREVVLVGHSFGGAVAQLVAQQVPDRLSRVVFYNAYVIADGEAVFSYVPESVAGAFTALASPDGTLTLPYSYFREHLMNDADATTAEWAYTLTSPEPLGRSAEKLDLAAFYSLAVPMSYLHAYDDNVFPASDFSWHPGMSQRLPDFRLVTIPGGHELMFSDPVSLADGLVKAGRP
jgi:pimeloyl-ACP methyl ester carboxylesterase